MKRELTVVIERDEDGYYVASVPELPGCHTQGRSLDEVLDRVKEAIHLMLEEREEAEAPRAERSGGSHANGSAGILHGPPLGPEFAAELEKIRKEARESGRMAEGVPGHVLAERLKDLQWPDDKFADDLEAIQASQPLIGPSPWDL